MTETQKDEVWRRWRTGESLSDIGRAVGKFPASNFGLLRLYGGLHPQRAVAQPVLSRWPSAKRFRGASQPAPRSVRLRGHSIVPRRQLAVRSRGTRGRRRIVQSGRMSMPGTGRVVRN